MYDECIIRIVKFGLIVLFIFIIRYVISVIRGNLCINKKKKIIADEDIKVCRIDTVDKLEQIIIYLKEIYNQDFSRRESLKNKAQGQLNVLSLLFAIFISLISIISETRGIKIFSNELATLILISLSIYFVLSCMTYWYFIKVNKTHRFPTLNEIYSEDGNSFYDIDKILDIKSYVKAIKRNQLEIIKIANLIELMERMLILIIIHFFFLFVIVGFITLNG